jgi:hypothetical protein
VSALLCATSCNGARFEPALHHSHGERPPKSSRTFAFATRFSFAPLAQVRPNVAQSHPPRRTILSSPHRPTARRPTPRRAGGRDEIVRTHAADNPQPIANRPCGVASKELPYFVQIVVANATRRCYASRHAPRRNAPPQASPRTDVSRDHQPLLTPPGRPHIRRKQTLKNDEPYVRQI